MKKSGIRKALNAVTTVLVVIVVLLAVALVGVRIVGIRTYAVISGSMEPVYPTGFTALCKAGEDRGAEGRRHDNLHA